MPTLRPAAGLAWVLAARPKTPPKTKSCRRLWECFKLTASARPCGRRQQPPQRTHPAQFIVTNPNFYLIGYSAGRGGATPQSGAPPPRSMTSIHICERHKHHATGFERGAPTRQVRESRRTTYLNARGCPTRFSLTISMRLSRKQRTPPSADSGTSSSTIGRILRRTSSS